MVSVSPGDEALSARVLAMYTHRNAQHPVQSRVCVHAIMACSYTTHLHPVLLQTRTASYRITRQRIQQKFLYYLLQFRDSIAHSCLAASATLTHVCEATKDSLHIQRRRCIIRLRCIHSRPCHVMSCHAMPGQAMSLKKEAVRAATREGNPAT